MRRKAFPGDGLPVHDRPLIGPLVPMLSLREEYENGSQYFVKQIDWLMDKGWIGIRRTRGDGQFTTNSLPLTCVSRSLMDGTKRLHVERCPRYECESMPTDAYMVIDRSRSHLSRLSLTQMLRQGILYWLDTFAYTR